MMLLIVAWAFIGACAFAIGHAAVSALDDPLRLRRGDWILLSLWVGLILIEWLALVFSLASPVSPQRFFPLVGIAALLALAQSGRTIAKRLQPWLRTDVVIAAVLTLAAAGFVAGGLRPTPDTGEYH